MDGLGGCEWLWVVIDGLNGYRGLYGWLRVVIEGKMIGREYCYRLNKKSAESHAPGMSIMSAAFQ